MKLNEQPQTAASCHKDPQTAPCYRKAPQAATSSQALLQLSSVSSNKPPQALSKIQQVISSCHKLLQSSASSHEAAATFCKLLQASAHCCKLLQAAAAACCSMLPELPAASSVQQQAAQSITSCCKLLQADLPQLHQLKRASCCKLRHCACHASLAPNTSAGTAHIRQAVIRTPRKPDSEAQSAPPQVHVRAPIPQPREGHDVHRPAPTPVRSSPHASRRGYEGHGSFKKGARGEEEGIATTSQGHHVARGRGPICKALLMGQQSDRARYRTDRARYRKARNQARASIRLRSESCCPSQLYFHFFRWRHSAAQRHHDRRQTPAIVARGNIANHP